MRRLVAEVRLSVDDLVAPLFVRDDLDGPVPIDSMPGQFQHSYTSLVTEAAYLRSLGIPALMLFGIATSKDSVGSQASDPDGVVQIALGELRSSVGESMVLISDLCLDEYTDHGHCGVLDERGRVDNDVTLERYKQVAVAQARAGADIVAPSGMMDGQVGAVRNALDGAGFSDVAILSYSAKYASALYGPFRDAVNVDIANGGSRTTYQQDWRNKREALEEVSLDVSEGADMVMVKPAVTSLDVIADVRRLVNVPVGAYSVSGEYSMIKAASERGWIDGSVTALELATVVKRAGADFMVTYFAKELAEMMN